MSEGVERYPHGRGWSGIGIDDREQDHRDEEREQLPGRCQERDLDLGQVEAPGARRLTILPTARLMCRGVTSQLGGERRLNTAVRPTPSRSANLSSSSRRRAALTLRSEFERRLRLARRIIRSSLVGRCQSHRFTAWSREPSELLQPVGQIDRDVLDHVRIAVPQLLRVGARPRSWPPGLVGLDTIPSARACSWHHRRQPVIETSGR
jgi:hypothetical protein